MNNEKIKKQLIQKNNWLESLIYIIACIFTLGAIWITRIVITMAIRKAFKTERDSNVR